MMLRCACGVKNYLDPYPFWNFKGRTKCAGCDAVYAVEIAGGAPVGEPKRTKSEDGPLVLPGFADTADWKPLVGPGKTRPAPQAIEGSHAQSLCVFRGVTSKNGFKYFPSISTRPIPSGRRRGRRT